MAKVLGYSKLLLIVGVTIDNGGFKAYRTDNYPIHLFILRLTIG